MFPGPEHAMLWEYFFLHKENKNNIIYSTIFLPPSYVFHHFRKYHNECTSFALSVNNAYSADYVHARAFTPNVNNADYGKYVLRYSPKWRKT